MDLNILSWFLWFVGALYLVGIIMTWRMLHNMSYEDPGSVFSRFIKNASLSLAWPLTMLALLCGDVP